MSLKLVEEGRAALDGRALCFGVVNADDLLVRVREHAGFPPVTKQRPGMNAQFPKDAQE